MKILAKVSLKEEETGGSLIRAFFQNFIPGNKINLTDNEATVELYFDNSPPLEIIEAISNYTKVQLTFTQTSDEQKTEKPVKTSGTQKTEEAVKNPKAQTVKKEPINRSKSHKGNKKPVKNIPILDEFATQASSFDEFIQLVGNWLHLSGKSGLFADLVVAATSASEITWKSLIQNTHANSTDQVALSKAVHQKFPDSSVTLLPFLSIMKEYKNYSFGQSKQSKMQCMPFIPEFEEALGNIDKTLTVEERVKPLLNVIGLANLSTTEQEDILKLVVTAVQLKELTYRNVFDVLRLPTTYSESNRQMTFSTFINDFLHKHSNQKVKSIQFLRELQEIIMNDDELT